MNDFLRKHGFGIALILGIAFVAVGLTGARLDAVVVGAVLTVTGIAARPVEEFALGRNGVTVKWMRETVEAVQRRLELRLGDEVTITDSVEAKVIRGGDVKAAAGVAEGFGHAHAAAVITRPQSPDEFAEMLVDKVIAPIALTPEPARLRLTTHPPDVRVGAPAEGNAPDGAQSGPQSRS